MTVLIDSSVLVAYWFSGDSNHDKAVNIIQKITEGKYGNPLISDYIFDETLTATLVRSKSISNAVTAGKYMKNYLDFVRLDEIEFNRAWQTFKEQKSTKLSFTDCTILSVMESHGISNLATFDSEFKKIRSLQIIS